MREFKSELENVMTAQELFLKATPGFGEYKAFLEHAMGHPAKMNMNLLDFLIKRFTKEGDVVLDPMAGSGSMAVVAALQGRNAVCVELEENFHGWIDGWHPCHGWECDKCKAREAKKTDILYKIEALTKTLELVEKRFRDIAEFRRLDILGVLSPLPHSANLRFELLEKDVANYPWDFPQPNIEHDVSGCKDLVEKTNTLTVKGHIKSICGDSRNLTDLIKEADVMLTSPPYSQSISKKAGGTSTLENVGISTKTARGYDAILTSPPYSESQTEVVGEKGSRGGDSKQRVKKDYVGVSKENIGNLRHGNVDTVITSPPYEGSLEGSTRHTRGGIASRDPALAQAGTYATRLSFGVPVGYSPKQDNIGNLKGETYLQAMLKVYEQCYKVLKSSGLAIIVIKPFIRNKKLIDLPFHTWLLLKKTGFKMIYLFKLRLERESFWRVLYKKKYPNVLLIRHEYVLVCQKMD